MSPGAPRAARSDCESTSLRCEGPDGDPGGMRAGCAVTVTPDDNARVPVNGTLVAASDSEIIIHRRDRQAGDLHIHFPRLGFDVVAS